jgi:hypothetical protein
MANGRNLVVGRWKIGSGKWYFYEEDITRKPQVHITVPEPECITPFSVLDARSENTRFR